MNDKFILEGQKVVPCENLLQWAKWMESADRAVAKDSIGGSEVSTVFLGLDHSFVEGGPPLVFETVVFDGEFDGEMDRYSTWDEAVKGHNSMVEKVKGNI